MYSFCLFRWARWDEIVDKNQFRKGWTQPVIEDCARIIVSCCYSRALNAAIVTMMTSHANTEEVLDFR